jgi:protein-disulfide isomerase
VQTFPQIKQAYEAKIRFVLRDFAIHGQPAVKMAEAAACANDQGKFWEYHDKLWETYEANAQQAQTGVDAVVTALKGYASDLGLDTAAFNECLDSDKYVSQVAKDYQDAQSYGATGTPAFFVNGRPLSGALPFEDYKDSSGATHPGFKSIIDQALAAAGAGSATPTATAPSGGGG